MKKSLIAVAVTTMVLAGCGAKEEMLVATQSQERLTKMVLDYHKDQEKLRADNELKLAQDKVKTLAEKYKSDSERFKALAKVAEKADAGGRVAIARSLEEKDFGSVDKIVLQPVAAPVINIPVVKMPETFEQKARAWAGIILPGLTSAGNVYVAAKQVSASVAINKQNNEAATAQHESTMGVIGTQSTNQANTAIATVQAIAASNGATVATIGDLVRDLTKDPRIVNNVTTGNDSPVVIGNGTATVVKCPQTQTGNAGDGGNGAPGGSGTNPTEFAAGGTGGSSGAAGNGGANNQTAASNCTGAGK